MSSFAMDLHGNEKDLHCSPKHHKITQEFFERCIILNLTWIRAYLRNERMDLSALNPTKKWSLFIHASFNFVMLADFEITCTTTWCTGYGKRKNCPAG